MITYFLIVLLLTLSALFSGLTLGLMSLSVIRIKRKKSLGDKNAAKVYAIRKNGNLLLTTLLVGNVAVNAILSIFLGTVTTSVLAVVIATVLIVIFGEIAPQAFFSRYALSFGAKLTWLVKIFIFVLYPVCKPMSIVLDKILGKELPTIYSKQELIKIIEEHEDSGTSDVNENEERIIKGALTFSNKKVGDVMTPSTVMKAMNAKQKITDAILEDLRKSEHTRIPVYKDTIDTIVGILYTKKLIGDRYKGKHIGRVADASFSMVRDTKTLDSVLNEFLKTRQHLFIVKNEFGSTVGIITLEDIL